MQQRPGNQDKPMTWYVIHPRDEPCAQVNPVLWHHFLSMHGDGCDPLLTECYCVQWLDQHMTQTRTDQEELA